MFKETKETPEAYLRFFATASVSGNLSARRGRGGRCRHLLLECRPSGERRINRHVVGDARAPQERK